MQGCMPCRFREILIINKDIICFQTTGVDTVEDEGPSNFARSRQKVRTGLEQTEARRKAAHWRERKDRTGTRPGSARRHRSSRRRGCRAAEWRDAGSTRSAEATSAIFHCPEKCSKQWSQSCCSDFLLLEAKWRGRHRLEFHLIRTVHVRTCGSFSLSWPDTNLELRTKNLLFSTKACIPLQFVFLIFRPSFSHHVFANCIALCLALLHSLIQQLVLTRWQYDFLIR